MSEMKVDISELKGEGSDIIKELTEFLEEKTKAEVETATNEIVVKGEGKAVSKKYVRVILWKFLHKAELKDYFRVIGSKENALIVKERKISEEE